jgi:hypothetical protein
MSRKSKLILATALFGAALFGASCGGGGGGGTASAPPPPPPPAPPASDVAKVLVLAAKGTTSPGATVGLYEGTIKSDGTISWSSDKNPGDNRLEYYHEFSNKSVLLYDEGDKSVYLYTGGTLNQVVGVQALSSKYHIFLPHFLVMDDGTSTPNVNHIITSNGRVVQFPGNNERLVYAGKDYLVVGDGATNEYVYIIKKDGSVTVLDWDDNPTSTPRDPISGGGVKLLDRVQGTDIILLGHTSTGTNKNAVYVILEDGTPVRITNGNNSSDGDNPVANIGSGKIMRDANGNIFVAINYTDGTDNLIEYFKIIPSGSGSIVFTTPAPINLGARASNPLRRGGYALDGNGRLYVIDYDSTATNYGIRTHFIDASNSYAAGPRYAGPSYPLDDDDLMLAFANGVLVTHTNPPASPAFYHVLGTSAPTNVGLLPEVIAAVSLCNQVNNESELTSENGLPYSGIVQEPVVGEGTNRLMCASSYVSGLRNQFAWVEASGTGTYNGRLVDNVSGSSTPSIYLMATTNSMIFWYDDQTFQECTFGASSCATRNLSKPVYWRVYYSFDSISSSIVTTFDKIKSDNNVLSDGAGRIYGGYWGGRAPNIKAVYFTNVISAPYTANIQTGAVDTSTLNVVFSSAPARGGNISLELDKAANVNTPVSGAKCPVGYYDHVWYKDATREFRELARPANTCLIRVLQVRTP